MQISRPHTPLLVQAPVKALDPDGAGIITLGTALFAAAAIFCWVRWDALTATGELWWLWVCVTGVVIGGLGMLITWPRHRRRKAGTEDTPEADEQPEVEPQHSVE